MATKDFAIENGTLVEYVGQGEAAIIPNGVTVIGQGAFRNCRNLTNITIPDSVHKIDHNAFRDCSSLISIVIPPKVAFVGWGAFMGCSNGSIPRKLTDKTELHYLSFFVFSFTRGGGIDHFSIPLSR